MKNLIQLLSISFFLILFSINTSAQKNNKIQLIGGLTFSSEYLYQNLIDHKNSNNIGVFGQVKFNKRFSTSTTFIYGQRSYALGSNLDLGWCGNGLTREFIMFTSYGYLEKSWTLEQLLKIHFNRKGLSYFIGVGGLLKLPQFAQSLPNDSEITPLNPYIASEDSNFLKKRKGIQVAGGLDYYCFKNIFISAQINWNIYSSDFLNNNSYSYDYSMFNANNVNFRIGVGYIFN